MGLVRKERRNSTEIKYPRKNSTKAIFQNLPPIKTPIKQQRICAYAGRKLAELA